MYSCQSAPHAVSLNAARCHAVPLSRSGPNTCVCNSSSETRCVSEFQLVIQDLDRSSGHGLVYLQRPSGGGGKAGNLNHALKHASGQVILVLDAGTSACLCPAVNALDPSQIEPLNQVRLLQDAGTPCLPPALLSMAFTLAPRPWDQLRLVLDASIPICLVTPCSH